MTPHRSGRVRGFESELPNRSDHLVYRLIILARVARVRPNLPRLANADANLLWHYALHL